MRATHGNAGETLGLDSLMAFLVTVARHLEDGPFGTRFHLVSAMAHVLGGDELSWSLDDLPALTDELSAIRRELAGVAAANTATFLFNEDEPHPDIFSRDTQRLAGTAAERFDRLLDALDHVVADASANGQDIRLELVGPRIDWWTRR